MEIYIILFIVMVLLFGLYALYRFFVWQIRLQTEQETIRRIYEDLRARVVRIEERIGFKSNKPK
jgi:regulatory protein YycI of two-component signal transduction system YycFG